MVKRESFQKIVDGKKIDLFTIKNDSGVIVKITNFGARVVSIIVPDNKGKFRDIALGYPSIEGYFNDENYAGAIIGRYANRIAKGKLKLDGKEYQLATNSGPNSLHGGYKGFDKVTWDAHQEGNALKLNYIAADMEEGFPGKLKLEIVYILSADNELKIKFSATTDKTTIINLVGHAYFNLKGEGNGDILNHWLEIFGDKMTPVDNFQIPVGRIESVKGTPFDFTTPHLVGQRINESNEQLKNGLGYDHNWVLNNQTGKLALAAKVSEPETGIVLEIFTTEPGIQFYSGNLLNSKTAGKSGKPFYPRSGLALEPQHYPDSPNHPDFPSTVLEPGKTYKSETVYKFSTNK